MLIILVVLVSGCTQIIFNSPAGEVGKCQIRYYGENDELVWNDRKSCYYQTCEALNMTYEGSSSWYDSTVDCEKNGATLVVDWRNMPTKECQDFFNKWIAMRNCVDQNTNCFYPT